MEFEPVIIIGAGRSGTNMLRDVLTSFSNFATWPCDEINYIWRYGNVYYSTDEFGLSEATESTKKFIRKSFRQIACKHGVRYVVEKTCANSLRVAFVNKVFPEAKFIFLVRDGRDVVASSMKRWRAALDIPYIFRKARYIPVADAPYYATLYLTRHIYRIFSKEKRVSSWGPRFEGMDEMLKIVSLPEVCAAQWTNCVEKASRDFYSMKSKNYLLLKYEEFVSHPVSHMQRIADFLSTKLEDGEVARSISSITDKNIGKWQTELDDEIIDKIMPYIRSSLEKYDYISPK